jgi:hypothetical protein
MPQKGYLGIDTRPMSGDGQVDTPHDRLEQLGLFFDPRLSALPRNPSGAVELALQGR